MFRVSNLFYGAVTVVVTISVKLFDVWEDKFCLKATVYRAIECFLDYLFVVEVYLYDKV